MDLTLTLNTILTTVKFKKRLPSQIENHLGLRLSWPFLLLEFTLLLIPQLQEYEVSFYLPFPQDLYLMLHS